MNRNKTAQLLNEWKSFLSESTKPKFEKKDEENLKVVVQDCCGSCSTSEAFKSFGIPGKDEEALEGVLHGHDLYNKEGQNIVLVLVKGEKEARHFPQCCVKRKSGDK